MDLTIANLVKILEDDEQVLSSLTNLAVELKANFDYQVQVTPASFFLETLTKWKSLNGSDATVNKLQKHLRNIGCHITADKLSHWNGAIKFSPLLTSAESSESLSHDSPDSTKSNFFRFGVKNTIWNHIERKTLFTEMEGYFRTSRKRIILITGLAGTGKTELTKAFIGKLKNSNTDAHVTWFDGKNNSSLKGSIYELCRLLGTNINLASTTDINEMNVTDLLHEVLERLPNSSNKWLIVIDNVDERYREVTHVVDFIRKSDQFYLMITSVIRNLLAESVFHDIVEVKQLTERESLNLVDISIKNQDLKAIELLCGKFQHFPLALQQAIAYISQQQNWSNTGNAYKVADYLKLLNLEINQKDVLGFESQALSREYSKTTLTAWNTTIGTIRNHHGVNGKNAIKALNITSLVHPENLKLQLLYHLFCSTVTAQSIKPTWPEFDEYIGLLKNYSMMSVENNIVDVHQLVQISTRFKLTNANKEHLILRMLEGMDFESITATDIPHVTRLWIHACEEKELAHKLSFIPVRISTTMLKFNMDSETTSFCRSNIKILQNVTGDTHLQTLRLRHNYARALHSVGNSSNALQIFQYIREMLQKHYKDEEEDIWECSQCIIKAFGDLKQPEDALKSCKQLELDCKSMRRIMETKLLLAGILTQLERYKESFEVYEHVMEWQIEEFGKHDPCTLTTHHNIAVAVFLQDNFEEARQFFEIVLVNRSKILGEKHMDTMKTKFMLAKTTYGLGCLEEAVAMLNDVLSVREETLGPSHALSILTKELILKMNQQLYLVPI